MLHLDTNQGDQSLRRPEFKRDRVYINLEQKTQLKSPHTEAQNLETETSENVCLPLFHLLLSKLPMSESSRKGNKRSV